jgi:LPS-assembly protein
MMLLMIRRRGWEWLMLVCGAVAVAHGQENEVDARGFPVPPPEMDGLLPVPAPELGFGVEGAMAPEMPKELTISNLGGGPITGSMEEGVRYEGPGVKITGDSGLEVFADRLFWSPKDKTVILEGRVSVYQGNTLQRGERVVYFYERKFLDTTGLRSSVDPFLLESGKFTMENRGGRNVYVGHDARVTTDDAENPSYWIKSDKTTIYPGEKIVFDNLKLYAGETPVFWFPYLSQPLDADLGYHFLPGGRSNWGAFLLNRYGVMLGGETDPLTGENKDAWLLSTWRLDLMSRRGVGAGVDLTDTRTGDRNAFPGLSLYYLNDLDPGVSRSGVPRGVVNEDRYQIGLEHRHVLEFPDQADWRMDFNLTWLSDRHYLEDFATREYRTNPQPDNTVGIFRRDDESLLSLYGRFRVNDFYRTDTRMPELAYDRARAPVFGTRIEHEGSTSIGYFGEQAGDPTRGSILTPLQGMTAGDPRATRLLRQLGGYERRLAEQMIALPLGDVRREAIRVQLEDSHYARFHTYQEWSLPMMLGGVVSVVPQAGVGYSNYFAVDGPQGDMDRFHIHGGVETSVKFTKDLGPVRNRALGLDGLLHVVQPYGFWSVVSTDDFEPGEPGVDRLTPTTRPRPLDPARFTAVDEMNAWNVMRMGARNRLFTKRDGQSFEWLYLDTYFDAFLNDPEGTRDFSNLYNDVRWQPLPWAAVELETQFPIADGGSGFREYATRLHLMPTESFEISLGYRILNGHPVLIDSNRLDLRTFLRLSENWGVGTRHVLELDDSTLESQEYMIHRDLGSWVAGIGLMHRDNRLEEEYGVALSLTLKEFPEVSLPFELDAQ